MNNEQRGVALLIVLMLLALMAALAADMTLSFHSQLQRTRQVNHHLQRQYDIELAEKLALASLTQDVKDNDRQTTLQQYWAQPQQLQLEDGNTVKWQLRDAQHCFNLNALAKISDDPLASPDFPAQVFSALLINAGIDRGNTDEIVQSIADYIDVDDSPRFHGAEDSFYQIQSFGNHLRANQNIRFPFFKVVDDALVGRAGAGGIQIHSGYLGLRKNLLDVILNFFRAESAVHKFHSSTSRTGCRHGVGIAAIMTRQLVKSLVIGQTYVAVFATWYPSTRAAFNHRGKTPSVLEQDDLFFLLQSFPYFL